MKRSFSDIFNKHYSARLLVGAADTRGGNQTQLQGFYFPRELPGGFVPGDGSIVAEKAAALILELKPDYLRYYAASAGAESIVRFCSEHQIFPQVVVDYSASENEIDQIVSESVRQIVSNDIWTAQRIYEIEIIDEELSSLDGDGIDEIILQLRRKAERICELDQDGIILLPGITPLDNDLYRANEWNRKLLENCHEVMDMLAVGWSAGKEIRQEVDESVDGLELACVLASKGAFLQNLSVQLDPYTGTDSSIRIAINWTYARPRPLRKQDTFFYTSVMDRFRQNSYMLGMNCCGPLFGEDGLIQIDGSDVWTDSAYEFFLTTQRTQPIPLKLEPDGKKPLPVCEWPGIPGEMTDARIELLEASASRSVDGKLVHLSICNRHPYRRADVRVELMGLMEMRPLEARILRASDRLACNLHDNMKAVHCADINLRKYRKMDHVNLDIPPAAVVSMLLTTD